MQEAWTCLIVAISMALSTRKGLQDPAFAARLGFDPILVRLPGQWPRYFTSAFVHPSWWSCASNALMLYWFGAPLEQVHGPGAFLAVYFLALGGGNWLQSRFGPDQGMAFTGSTAGTGGVFFCSLLLWPEMRILGLPTWLFTLLYFILAIHRPMLGGFCLFCIRTADLFGASMGLAAGLAIHPRVAVEHPFYTPYLIAVTTGFLFYHWRNPLNLPFNQVFRLPRWRGPAPKGPPAVELATEEEVDRLLDKISTQGLQSLSARERSFLEKASKQRRN